MNREFQMPRRKIIIIEQIGLFKAETLVNFPRLLTVVKVFAYIFAGKLYDE